MYKCKNCGNTEKFIGRVSEKSSAFIYQEHSENNKKIRYSWIFRLCDNCWKSNIKIQRCALCKSRRIEKI